MAHPSVGVELVVRRTDSAAARRALEFVYATLDVIAHRRSRSSLPTSRAACASTCPYVDERILVEAEMDGAPKNVVDLSAIDADEIDAILRMVFCSLRRQIVERCTAGAHALPGVASTP